MAKEKKRSVVYRGNTKNGGKPFLSRAMAEFQKMSVACPSDPLGTTYEVVPNPTGEGYKIKITKP